VSANGTTPRRRARLRIRPFETDPACRVLTASGRPSGLRLVHDERGLGIVRAPSLSPEQRAAVASTARANGERRLTVAEHERIRRLALRTLSPAERWDRLLSEATAGEAAEKRTAQRLDLRATVAAAVLTDAEARKLATAPVRPKVALTASAKARPLPPPRGRFFVRREGEEMVVFERIRGGGEVQVPAHRVHLTADGRPARHDFAAELANLQEQEDEIVQKRENEAAVSGLAAFARNLLSKFDRIGSTPPVVNVTVPPTVVNVPATNVTVPTPQVTVTPQITVTPPNVTVEMPPRPSAIRVETDEYGNRIFIPED
jgi:hypothetical protein